MQNPSKPNPARRQAWQRARTYAHLTGCTPMQAWQHYKSWEPYQLDWLDYMATNTDNIVYTHWETIFGEAPKGPQKPSESPQGPPKGIRRPSKGDPNRTVRAGAPNEYIPQAPTVPLRALQELRKVCEQRFQGNWGLLAEFANTLANTQQALQGV